MSGPKFNGIINVNKDKGMTSHDVVNILRRILNMKKIGHTGTLDPDVTGVLPICLGKATRLSEFIQNDSKTYEGRLKFGIKTDTQDLSGEILEESSLIPTIENIDSIRTKYMGEINQTPPMFSAVHQDGVRLYELARQGLVIERKSRKVFIHKLDFKDYNYPYLSFLCECSKGTYVRTLVEDIGNDLGSLAALESLVRTKVNIFKLEESFTLDEIARMVENNDYSFINPMDIALGSLKRLDVASEDFEYLINGVKITCNYDLTDENCKIYCNDTFIGIGNVQRVGQRNKIIMNKMLYVR